MATSLNPRWLNLKSAGTYVISSVPCKLERIIINTTANGAITVCDGTQLSGAPTIATIKASIPEGDKNYDISTNVGLTIVMAAASDITVVYR
jgi:hypothetical protein